MAEPGDTRQAPGSQPGLLPSTWPLPLTVGIAEATRALARHRAPCQMPAKSGPLQHSSLHPTDLLARSLFLPPSKARLST